MFLNLKKKNKFPLKSKQLFSTLLDLLVKSIHAYPALNSLVPIYTPAYKPLAETGTIGVNFLAQEHNAVPLTWLKL